MRQYSGNFGTLTRTATLLDGSGNTSFPGSLNATSLGSDLKKAIGNMIYPKGSLYISYESTSPVDLFGGSWTQIKDTFLYCANSAGATGGSSTHNHTNYVRCSSVSGLMLDGSCSFYDAPANTWKNLTAGTNKGKVTNRCESGISMNTNNITSPTLYEQSFRNSSASSMPPYMTVFVGDERD